MKKSNIHSTTIIVLFFVLLSAHVIGQSIKKGPYLIFEGTNTEMKVVWQDEASYTDIIRWGTTTSYSDGNANSTEYGSDHQHAYVINGLTPGTKYFYQVESTGSTYNGSFYATPDASATSLKFLAYGDTRSYPNDHNLVAEEIISTYTADPEYQSVLISMGDLVNDGNSEGDWSGQFFETGLQYINSMLANIPYQSCIGNHEGNGVLFQKYFPYNYESNRYYSYEYGPALFIILDQYVSYAPGSAQYIWLENELSTTTKAWKIIYFHEPGWTAGGHSNNTNVQNYIQPLCEQYGVKITFAGHNHYYARAEVTLNNTTVQHITTGGGGAPLYSPDPTDPYIVATSMTHHFCKINIVDGNAMYVDVIDKDGTLIDQFTINQSNNSYPSVSITAPSDNTHYNSPQTITISADATDSDGTISQVEFFVEGASVGTDNSSPYSVDWSIPDNGAYSITAKATDDMGAFTNSTPINITVGVFTELVSSRISSGNDDVEEASDGRMYLTSSDIELVYDSYDNMFDQTVGLRFTGLGIPHGVTINSAYIQFTVDEVTSGATDLTIFGHDIDDSPGFSSTANNVSNRTKTTASVAWIPPAWSVVGEAGTDQQTPDLSGIIQEIVDRPAFSQSGAISLIITGTGTRVAEAYEGVAGLAVLLTIEYSTAPGNNSPQFDSDPIVETDATEDAVYSSSIADNASDPDGDVLTFSKVLGPGWLDVAADGTLSGTPVNANVGLNNWTVKVDDGNGGTNQAILQITVINTNDLPVFDLNPIVEIDATENEAYISSIADNAYDPDEGDVLSFSKVSGPAWLDVAANGTLSGTPLNGDVGLNSWLVKVDDGNGGTDETELQIEVTELTIVTYCNSYSQNYSSEYISSVDVGNLSKSSVGSSYSDFTNNVFNADPGVTYNITLTPWKSNPSRKESWRVWIDYNIDGDFEDAGELVFSTDRKRNPVTGTFTIPSGASGNTRMRVAMAYSTTSMGPCNIISYGEVEDYTISMSTPVPQPPVADFTANITTITEGQSVQFTDLTANDPTSWSWTFAGGTPATSTAQNPLVTYNTQGTYSVTLIATNALGSDTHTKTGYIVVTEPGNVTYCTSQSSSNALEWISQVDIASFSNASGASFYSDYTAMIINFVPGSSNNVTLTPHFTGKDQREFWRIWIDFNGDGDFEDADETVFSVNNKKTAVSGTINIPTYASEQTRMRVTMKNGSAPSSCESFGGGEVEDYTVSFVAGSKTTPGDEIAEEFSFKIYPNPVANVLNLNISGAEELISISVYSAAGMLIKTVAVENGNHKINTGNYPGGIYYIRVQTGDNLIMKKFIKM